MARCCVLACCLAGAVPLLSGCGTVKNLAAGSYGNMEERSSHPEIYGGVHRDLDCAASCLVWGSPLPELLGDLLWVPPIVCIDLPLSAIGDTLTLPLVIHASRVKNGGPEQPMAVSPSGEDKPPAPDGR
jgi:uncharacterized protein YceK